jgi:hypothetical protein
MRFTPNILSDRNPRGRSRKEPVHLGSKPTPQPTLQETDQSRPEAEKFLWVEIPKHHPEDHTVITLEAPNLKDRVEPQDANRSTDQSPVPAREEPIKEVRHVNTEEQQADNLSDQLSHIDSPQNPDGPDR